MTKMLTAVLVCLLSVAASQAADLKSQLLVSDKALWTAMGKREGAAFRKSLTADAVYVAAGAIPIKGRETIASEIENSVCTRGKFTLENVSLRQLASTIVELSYDVIQTGECDGTPLPAKLRATSLYLNQNGKWLVTLHQQTPVELE